MIMPKKRQPVWDLEPYEKEISVICRDFERFCGYVLDHKNIVTKKTGSLNRQACFEINGLLSFRQTYEKPTRNQQAYPVIQLFAGVAAVFEILEIDDKGGSLIKGKNWDVFQKASPIQRYVFFWCCAFFSLGEVLKLLPDVLLTSQILYAYGKLETVSDVQAFFRTDEMMFIKKEYDNVRVLMSGFGLWPQSEEDKGPVEFFKLMGKIFHYLNENTYFGAQFNSSEECYERLMPCVRGMENSPLQEILYKDEPERSQYEGMTVDFGDAWWFDIKAVKITEGHVSEAQVIQRHNDPPAQYGDAEDGYEDW